ncbi:hypothetical protein RchiOBHm_Chr4g0427251 [Rosa chinensis]|uniref:Uncharacterized protein n=1 Tax=Rosa chinensis TaxID=74649 RepID=A0A2P6QZS0_ROSCH|nr:hypothetical protein RchiOBHm_Chr4g0427251 [Rosa chinensis]
MIQTCRRLMNAIDQNRIPAAQSLKKLYTRHQQVHIFKTHKSETGLCILFTRTLNRN